MLSSSIPGVTIAERASLERELWELGLPDRPPRADLRDRREFEILPPDTREYWPNTLIIPYRWICSLEFFVENPAYGPKTPKWLTHKGTGVLVGPDCVLTAAHSLWREVDGKQRPVKRIDVAPARDGKLKPFGSVDASAWRTPSGWDPKTEPRGWDFAVVRLKQPIGSKAFKGTGGNRLGWWGDDFGDYKTLVTPLDPVWLKNRDVTSAGYPGDTCGKERLADRKAIERCQRDKPELHASSQWRGAGKILSIDCSTGLLHHTIDTYEGQSGSPIWYVYDDKERNQQRRWLVGLHVAPGTSFQVGEGGQQTRIDNVGVWIRQKVLDEIATLAAQLGSTPATHGSAAKTGAAVRSREQNLASFEADQSAAWRDPGVEYEGPRIRANQPKPQAPLPPACAHPSPWPDLKCSGSKPAAAVEQRRIVRLCQVIIEGIQTKQHDPNSSGGPGLFAGSYDWHSAVHAHWALLSIAHVRSDRKLEAWISNRLTDKALRAERDFLKRQKKQGAEFEQPYGRAWLLLLLDELARRSRTSKELTSLQQEVQESVLGWLERSLYPERGTKDAPRFIAQHDSWLFAYMLFAMSNPKPANIRDRLRALRKNKIEPARGNLAAAKHGNDDFLYLPAVQAVVDRVDAAATGKPAPYPVGTSPPLFDPPLDASNAHSAGAALVRIWPHAIDSHAGDEKACSRYHARMNEVFSRTDHWADSFELVSHWVPQFMWMALWLEAGRP